MILKEVFGMAAARLRARGPEWAAQAEVWPAPRRTGCATPPART
ncbi:hypothetical protein D8I24_0255 (plasmid) [Cupriavidus necator H850]|nr:hypothetical protein D8I24_0255 [Cupriavidus necator H850]